MSTVHQSADTNNDATAATDLAFSLNPDPDPIRVSPATGTVETADLVIVASRRSSEAIECNKIVIVVPTGPNSPDLALDLEGIDAQTSLTDWTATTNAQAKTITFLPTAGHATIGRDEGITLQLMGVRINRQVGTAPLTIHVYSRVAGDEADFMPNTTTLEIGKFPADFYLRYLIADPLIIDNGGTVTLRWEAGGVSSLRLLYDTADVNVLDKNTYRVDNVSHTTVFYLRATVQVGNGTAERILSTTVTVNQPDLDVGNLTVHGRFAILLRPTAKAKIGPQEVETHELEAMLDGNRDTYYLSEENLIGYDSVEVHFGPEEQRINSVDIYLGDVDGDFLGPENWSLQYWKREGSSAWYWADLAHYPRNSEIHYTSSAGILTTGLRLLADHRGGGRLAIRSFEVGLTMPEAVLVTGRSAHFRIPITGTINSQTATDVDDEYSGTDGAAPPTASSSAV